MAWWEWLIVSFWAAFTLLMLAIIYNALQEIRGVLAGRLNDVNTGLHGISSELSDIKKRLEDDAPLEISLSKIFDSPLGSLDRNINDLQEQAKKANEKIWEIQTTLGDMLYIVRAKAGII